MWNFSSVLPFNSSSLSATSRILGAQVGSEKENKQITIKRLLSRPPGYAGGLVSRRRWHNPLQVAGLRARSGGGRSGSRGWRSGPVRSRPVPAAQPMPPGPAPAKAWRVRCLCERREQMRGLRSAGPSGHPCLRPLGTERARSRSGSPLRLPHGYQHLCTLPTARPGAERGPGG